MKELSQEFRVRLQQELARREEVESQLERQVRNERKRERKKERKN
jgi:hypothetical protein